MKSFFSVLSGRPQYEEDVLVLDETNLNSKIILFNDDVNTFDWVIDSLIEVCNHELIQAEQCAHIVHYSGKCIVKEGSYKKLEPMASALLDRGLSATIE